MPHYSQIVRSDWSLNHDVILTIARNRAAQSGLSWRKALAQELRNVRRMAFALIDAERARKDWASRPVTEQLIASAEWRLLKLKHGLAMGVPDKGEIATLEKAIAKAKAVQPELEIA